MKLQLELDMYKKQIQEYHHEKKMEHKKQNIFITNLQKELESSKLVCETNNKVIATLNAQVNYTRSHIHLTCDFVSDLMLFILHCRLQI